MSWSAASLPANGGPANGGGGIGVACSVSIRQTSLSSLLETEDGVHPALGAPPVTATPPKCATESPAANECATKRVAGLYELTTRRTASRPRTQGWLSA